ncbi:hypothetical protein BDW42DRAFT_199292 [Aspergillus taichungensis]|uniref:Mitochondrial division protein 1 n=1 Tax=Aspergillus taichungensis TaxID=482145 RepID=A0A2J5HFN2_9EURO|nr:hypothetical protein BDW42DRAFT_199292 [Aspergillus taichungensis]
MKVDGLFIYAATVCRFLNESGLADDPNDRLAMIFNNEMGADSPQENLDRLYVEILSVGLRGNKHKVEIFKYIIGSIVVLHHQLSPRVLARLVYPTVKDSETQEQWAKVSNCLGRLHSFLEIPEDSEDDQSPIQLLHLSFKDFLLDDGRYDGDFHIDEKKAHSGVFERCIEIMQYYLRRKNICQLEHVATRAHEVQATQLDQYLPEHAQYACCHWMYHLEKSDICNEDAILDFLRTCFTHWVEAMSLMRKTAEGIPMLDALRIYTSQETVYASALPFAPRKSLVRQHTSVAEQWDTLLHMLHDDGVIFCCCDFSPSGNYMASGSQYGTIHLWNTSTWKCERVLEGHKGTMQVLTFVAETLLASTSSDNTIRLWYLDTGLWKMAPKSLAKVTSRPDPISISTTLRQKDYPRILMSAPIANCAFPLTAH